MSYISCDIEADGPIISIHSMVSFGAVIVEPSLSKTFYGKTKPISKDFIPEALAISGFSRKEHETFDEPAQVMANFANWIMANSKGQPILISDNNGFDASWLNYYFHRFYGNNPFGWSSRRIGDLYCGFVNDSRAKWKHLRGKNPHNHNALSDSIANANALLEMQKMGLNIDLR